MVTPIFGIVPMPKDGPTSLPDPVNPYYVVAQNGVYLHKRNALGKFLIPIPSKELPAAFYGELPKDMASGLIWKEFDPLPAWLIGQTVDFFQKVYNEHKAEAEVLITYKADADPKYRLFVPHQRVSSGAVHSLHDAGNFERGWQLIGSIHSHASMGAFHSGTDTNDASQFPGLHITIGHFDKPEQEYAAMVMVNTTRWDYKIEDVADTSQAKVHPSPGWWMRYIVRDKDVPKKSKNLTAKQIQDFAHGVREPRKWTYSPSAGNYGIQTNWADVWDDDYGAWDRQHVNSTDEYPRPPMTREGYRYSAQMGGLIRANLLMPYRYSNIVNPLHAVEAFADRLDELVELAEQFGIEIQYDLIDHADITIPGEEKSE